MTIIEKPERNIPQSIFVALDGSWPRLRIRAKTRSMIGVTTRMKKGLKNW
jgi:hypothetical protein